MEYALSELFTLQMGKTPSRDNSSYWGESENSWISIADLTNSGKYISNTKETLSDLAVAESGIKKIPANTVIMSFKLSLGKVAITEKEMYSNEAIMAFIDKGVEKISPEYLYYLLRAKDWSKGTNKAVMGATLNKTTLSTIKIRFHEYDNQLEIVNILNRVSSSIELRQRQLTKLDELIKARFVEMFGDPVANIANWPIERLEKHLTIIGGYAFKSDGFRAKGIPVLRIGNINSGYFQPTNMVYWHDDSTLERYKIHPGDLVISLTGTVGKNDYGNVCILGNDYSEYYLNQRNAKLELKETLNGIYLSELLKFPQIKGRLTGISRGIRQANISNKDILSLPILIPPISLQKQFATFVERVDQQKQTVQQSLEKLELMKKALMQEYFG